MNDQVTCRKDFLMENGAAAFLAGRRYWWRWTTEEEQDDTGGHLVLEGELGPDHFLTLAEYLAHFED